MTQLETPTFYIKNLKLYSSYFFKIVVVFIIVFSSSCQITQQSKFSDKISPQEREWLTQFFNDIMLLNHGIYTLLGSHKPMTFIAVGNYSEEEMKDVYNSYSEEKKKEQGFSIDTLEGYTLSSAWEKWELISHRFPMKKYMLFKIEDEDPHLFFIVFLDIIKTAAVIQENYEDFQKAMGFDFHPIELTLQMNQKDSVFWKTLNSYHYGLLFGYGKMNSQIFHWKHFDHPQSCDKFFNNIDPEGSSSQLKGKIKFTIDNFQIPSFKVFSDIEPMVNIYNEERKMIKKIYKDGEFLDLTLQKLIE